MGVDRERAFKEALKLREANTKSARASKRAKDEATKPWRVLEGEWHEQVHVTFGKDFRSSKWGVVETKLAKALLKEVELATAIDMIKRFISTWKKDGAPGFGYFWRSRDSYLAIERGQVKTKRERINQDEFDEERAKGLPDIGW